MILFAKYVPVLNSSFESDADPRAKIVPFTTIVTILKQIGYRSAYCLSFLFCMLIICLQQYLLTGAGTM